MYYTNTLIKRIIILFKRKVYVVIFSADPFGVSRYMVKSVKYFLEWRSLLAISSTSWINRLTIPIE